MGDNSAPDAALHKAFILHCCRRDYLKLLNASLAKSPHYEFFPLAVYAAFKVVEWRRWHQWAFLLSQLDALETLYGASDVGFLFKTARFRAQLIVGFLVSSDNKSCIISSVKQTFLHLNQLNESQGERLLVEDHNNTRPSSPILDVSTHHCELKGPATEDSLVQTKLYKLWQPLSVLMKTIWELLIDALLKENEAYDIKSHLRGRAANDILKSSPMRGSTQHSLQSKFNALD